MFSREKTADGYKHYVPDGGRHGLRCPYYRYAPAYTINIWTRKELGGLWNFQKTAFLFVASFLRKKSLFHDAKPARVRNYFYDYKQVDE